MAIESDPLHVSDVMGNALGHLYRVVEHVREEFFPDLQVAGLIMASSEAKVKMKQRMVLHATSIRCLTRSIIPQLHGPSSNST